MPWGELFQYPARFNKRQVAYPGKSYFNLKIDKQ